MRYIALLRGINVGGKRKILMNDLKELFTDIGLKNPINYIQSGNIIFDSESQLSKDELASKIAGKITNKYGFDVPVLVISVSELKEIIQQNSFFKIPQVDIKKLHLTLLKTLPLSADLKIINQLKFNPDKFKIMKQAIFIYCDESYSKSKLTNTFFEKKLKVSATTRNWKTVLKLLELSGEAI